MNVIQKLTLRHLRLNLRRTVVTVMGIIISVAMITAVAASITSFSSLLYTREESRSGKYMAEFININTADLENISGSAITKDLTACIDGGNARIEGIPPQMTNMLSLRKVESGYFDLVANTFMPGGRAPAAENELVLTAEFIKANHLDVQVGDKLTLQNGKRFAIREKEDGSIEKNELYQNSRYRGDDSEIFEVTDTADYTLVGILNYTGDADYSGFLYMDRLSLSDDALLDAFITANTMDKSTASAIDAIKVRTEARVKVHDDLLLYKGIFTDPAVRAAFYGVCGVMMGIIMAASIALIYNAFAVSLNERTRYLGMLGSVGATRRQKRSSVYFEGLVLGVIGIPIGILFGLLGIGITFKAVEPYVNQLLNTDGTQALLHLRLSVSPASILLIVAVSALTILLSAYIPARRASKISPIDAIRGAKDTKIRAAKLRTLGITRKIFGYEGELASKNMKRNRRKYRVMTASLALSVILFLSVNGFTQAATASTEMMVKNSPYDIRLITTDEAKREKMSAKLAKMQGASVKTMLYADLTVTGGAVVAEENRAYVRYDERENGVKNPLLTVIGLEDAAFAEYCADLKLDPKRFYGGDTVGGVLENQIQYEVMVDNAIKVGKCAAFENAENTKLQLSHIRGLKKVAPVEVRAVVNKGGVGADYGMLGHPRLILPESEMQSVLSALSDSNLQIEGMAELFVSSETPAETAAELRDWLNTNGMLSSVYMEDVHAAAQQSRALKMIISVFAYGFIALMALIGTANILNTISTGVNLRRREFAMLKSVGMTPKGFHKMIMLESVLYGVKALLIGLPVGFFFQWLFHKLSSPVADYGFWINFSIAPYIVATLAVLLIVTGALSYSVSKVRKENIIDVLKSDN